jgi:hypothetical protein
MLQQTRPQKIGQIQANMNHSLLTTLCRFLLVLLHTLPISTASIELCRCAADFERFYDASYHQSRDSHSVTTQSNRYPYNYKDHYIDENGYVIVEGIRVLSDSSTACERNNNNNNNNNNDDDAEEERPGRYLMMGRAAPQITMSETNLHRRLMGMMMMMDSSEKVNSKHVSGTIFCF